VFPIVEPRFLGPEIKHFRVLAPRIARKRRAGQFVIVAMGAGSAAVKTIHEFLSTGNWQRAKRIAGQIDRRTNWKKER